MNSDATSLDHQLLTLLRAGRDTRDDSARAKLNGLQRNDPAARWAMARLMVDEQALINRLSDDSIVLLLDPAPSVERGKVFRPPRWFSWRRFAAAAAGNVFGKVCTSVVFGFGVPFARSNTLLEGSHLAWRSCFDRQQRAGGTTGNGR